MGAGDMGLLRHWVYDWGGLNTQLMLWINRSMSTDWIGLARALSAIGSYWGAPVMGLLLLAWQAVKRSEPAALAPFRFGIGVLVAMLLAWTAKVGLALSRPSDLYANDMAWVLGNRTAFMRFRAAMLFTRQPSSPASGRSVPGRSDCFCSHSRQPSAGPAWHWGRISRRMLLPASCLAALAL